MNRTEDLSFYRLCLAYWLRRYRDYKAQQNLPDAIRCLKQARECASAIKEIASEKLDAIYGRLA